VLKEVFDDEEFTDACVYCHLRSSHNNLSHERRFGITKREV
jgi:hypothetical protein